MGMNAGISPGWLARTGVSALVGAAISFLSSDKSGWGDFPPPCSTILSQGFSVPDRADAEHLGVALRALSLDGGSSILHGDSLSSIDISLAPALEAVYVDHSGPPLMLIFGSLPAPVGSWIRSVYSGVGRRFLASGFITMGVVLEPAAVLSAPEA